MTTRRIYQLKKGDWFKQLGILFRVTEIDSRYIYYYHIDPDGVSHSAVCMFGCFNQAKVEIIEKPKICTL